MPRQRIYYRRSTYELPDDFPERLKRFQEESGLSWSEIARRLGTYRHTVWRWAEGKARPNYPHRKALMELGSGAWTTETPCRSLKSPDLSHQNAAGQGVSGFGEPSTTPPRRYHLLSTHACQLLVPSDHGNKRLRLTGRLARSRRRFCLPCTLVELGGLVLSYTIAAYCQYFPHSLPQYRRLQQLSLVLPEGRPCARLRATTVHGVSCSSLPRWA